MIVVDRRQFIIMRDRYVRDDFLFCTLSCGLVLSYHKDLNIVEKNGNILLGYAFSADDEEVDLTYKPEEKMAFWAGRWILITPDALYLDACGHMGIFYAYHKGEVVLSSSLHLISTIVGTNWVANHVLKRGESIFDFYPIPYTPYDGVMSLLPSEYFSFDTMTVCKRNDFDFLRYMCIDENILMDQFINGFANILNKINKEYQGNIWVPLTSGVDSRCVLALTQYSHIDVNTYTIIRDDTPKWDINVPPKISSRLSVHHQYLDNTTKRQTGKSVKINEHCGGLVSVGTERSQVLSESDIPNAENSIVLWGTTWELGTQYYWPHFQRQADSIKQSLLQINSGCSNVHEDSLSEWASIEEAQCIPGLDWKERLYWEQRQGAWLRYSYQVIDLLDSTRVSPINCQYLLELFLMMNYNPKYSEAEIQNRIIEKKIIGKTCPQIANFRYGEPTGFVYRGIRKTKRIISNMRKQ